jgi:hypothetical protein
MICSACVIHPSLRDLVNRNGHLGICSYCKTSGTTVEIKFLFDYIYDRVRENVAAKEDLSQFEHAMLYEFGSDEIAISTCDVIFEDWFNLQDEVFYDELCDCVPDDFKTNSHGEETHFYADTGLLEYNFYENKWANFIDEIRHAHRFFNPNARSFLDSVFKFVEWHPKLSHFEENLHPNLSHPNRLSCLIFKQGWARSDQRGNFEQITQTCPSRQGLHPTS